MVDRTQIDLMAIVRTFISGATGLTLAQVILGNQSAPAPNGPYATVVTTSVQADGVDWINYVEDDPGEADSLLDATTVGNREASFSVQFFREDVFEHAREVLQYPHTPNGHFFLLQNKMAWRSESPIINSDQVNPSNVWDNRAGITLNLGFKEITIQQINSLTSQEYTVDYSGESDLQETINVTTN